MPQGRGNTGAEDSSRKAAKNAKDTFASWRLGVRCEVLELALPALVAWFGLSATTSAQSLQFYAKPYTCSEGDAVNFYYLDKESTVGLSQIKAWKWDFNGDGTWDEQRTVNLGAGIYPEAINTTWYSVYNAAKATNGVQTITPRLQVSTNSGVWLPTQVGITEDVFGINGQVDPAFTVKRRSAGNASLIVNFSANPRLVTPTTQVRFYAEETFRDGVTNGTINSYSWDLDGDSIYGDSTDPNPTYTYSSVTGTNEVTIGLQIGYTVGGVTTNLADRKAGFIRVQNVTPSLQLGRAYRRGFPETYGWEDIIKAYSASGAGGDRYTYFGHFQDAYDTTKNALVGDPEDAFLRQQLAESINELLQGQILLANQRLVEALRIKYPRMASYDPNNPPDVLPQPAGAREETAAIETALLDYLLPIRYAASAIATYGADILRDRAEEGVEPFPQFPRYIGIIDPSLSPIEIPAKNEYWQLTSAFERMALGRVEKAKKLFRLSAKEPDARLEAKEECKVVATQSYLGMALLAAGQTETQFAENEGNNLRAHMKNARDLFEMINAGVNPLGNDGSFVPNESFTAIYQDAQDAVADARDAEIRARQEERTWDQYQAEMRNELLAQRNNYITPLKNLTSIDPALYNNLQTADDQRDYRNTVDSRLQSLLKDYPNADPAILGELGEAVIQVLDAGLAVQQARNEVANLYKKVDLAKWANLEINKTISTTSDEIRAIDMAMGFLDAQTAMIQTIASGDLQSKVSGINVGLGIRAFAVGVMKTFMADQRSELQTLQQMSINSIGMEKEVRGILIEQANLSISVERQINALRQAQLSLQNQLSRMDRLIEDLAHTRATASNLYFQDPSFRVVVSDAMRRAEAELDFAVDRLYRLAKTLEYEWTEGYANPVTIPVSSGEPASLENPLFDQFTQTDSLFFIRGSDEAKDYLDALRAWDSKLRRINGTSVRGPNHSGPISAEPISLREDILNLTPEDTRGFTLEDSIRAFRNYLETKRVENHYNVGNPSMEIEFQTTIEDNRFFPATGSRWNMRIASISADVYAESGFNTTQVAEIDLIESGVVSLRRYWADPPEADDVMKLTFNVGDANRTAFAVAFPAKINGATGGRPANEFINTGLANRPIAATKWILKIDTENPANRDIDFSKIKDIVLHFTYTYGNPEEFPNF